MIGELRRTEGRKEARGEEREEMDERRDNILSCSAVCSSSALKPANADIIPYFHQILIQLCSKYLS